ncbi:alpha/beta hydrolase family protein [Cryptosporangium arvum]|uniref:alpha/beta hydrolase family protein n=1 Tax=Cryptosporangium arvum TaxID=80871 RepID=UPI0004B49018|nr:alpha/beta fold hydrolase [Cryptosporangium arvum]
MTDPLITDPLITDPDPALRPPAVTQVFTVPSAGLDLLGVLHRPAGPGPHPAVAVLHGFPGNERNFDLAHALRRAGYASLVFHYRGAWGSPGTFSWAHVQQDAAAAVVALRADPGLDPDRIALVGHSMGGFTALRAAAADPGVRAVASIAGFDFGAAAADVRADPAVYAAYVDGFAGDIAPLAGTGSAALVAEMATIGDRLTALAPALAGRPVLLVAGDRDTTAPPAVHHEPLLAALPHATHREWPTDHAFSDHRVALARAVVEFLDASL